MASGGPLAPPMTADSPSPAAATILAELRQLTVTTLRLSRAPESVDPDTDLLGPELGLDSVDMAALLTAFEKHFDIELTPDDLARRPLRTLSALAEVVVRRQR
jgi:acyl carrier protein